MSALILVVELLFGLKIVWNLGVPYALARRARAAQGEAAPGISLMPGIEIVLLLLACALAAAAPSVWPGGPGRVALIGGAMVLGSYLHMVLAAGVLSRLSR